MDIRESGDDSIGAVRDPPSRPDDGTPEAPRTAPAEPERSPEEFVEWVADCLDRDPEAAVDAVGGLLAVVRESSGGTRVAAGEALDAIGRRMPRGLEVWSDALAEAATDPDDEVAFFAMRALAQLAACSPAAATKGRSAALSNLTAPHPDLRLAALSVLAEVGPREPAAVQRADRPLAAAFENDRPEVRTAAAIAAGRLLAAAPGRFPRSATALVAAVDDEADRVREFALVAVANLAVAHPSNVPERERVIETLASVSDDELGLRRGTVGEALGALVAVTLGADGEPA